MCGKMLERIWRFLTSTRTAVLLIGFMAVSAMVAGLVPQGKDCGYYIAGVFTGWWFLGAESLLLVSLTACVIKRTRHARRMASFFPIKRSPTEMRNSAWCLVRWFPGGERRQAILEAKRLARQRGFSNLHGEDAALEQRWSGLRNRWAYWSSPVLHLGLIVLLLGLILTPFTALNEYYEAGEGEVISLREDGFPFDILVKDFQIEYYDNYRPRQYVSRLAVLAGDVDEAAEGVVLVNHPLRHTGVKIYQSDWGWVVDGVLVAGDGRESFAVFDGRKISLGKQSDPVNLGVRFYPDVYVGFDGAPGSRTPEPHNPGVWYRVARSGAPPQTGLAALDEKIMLDGMALEFSGFRYYTGLQVKKEPFLPLIFLGFILALSGLVTFYLIRPRRLWVLVTPAETGFLIYLAGDGKSGKSADDLPSGRAVKGDFGGSGS